MKPLFIDAARDPGPLLMLVAALGAGLAAAYGRELQAGRQPSPRWWLARLLLLPLLAIGATTATEMLGLSPSMTAFAAAMLSLGGYDGLHLMESRWRARVKSLADANLSGPTDQQAAMADRVSEQQDD